MNQERLCLWVWRPAMLRWFVAFAVGSAVLLAWPVDGHTTVKVEFTDTVTNTLRTIGKDPEEQRRDIEEDFNRGLEELGKTNPAAKALFDSNQTIKIVCYGDEEAGDRKPTEGLGLMLSPEPFETVGDFNEDGTPKANGTTLFLIDCDFIAGRQGFYHDPEGDSPALFEPLTHELLHATHRDRRHPPDEMSLYREWETAFAEALERADRRARREERRRRRAGESSQSSLLPADGDSATENVGFFGDGFEVSFGYDQGTVDLGGWSAPIKLEIGGDFVSIGDFEFDEEDFHALKGDINVPLGGVFPESDLDDLTLNVRLRYGGSDFGIGPFDIDSGDADASVILDPQGLTGPFGGGGLAFLNDMTFPDFGDHIGVRAEGDYHEYLFGLGVTYTWLETDSYTLKPRLGLFYGFTDQSVFIEGSTAVIDGTAFFDYFYDTEIDSDRFGIEAGLGVTYDLGEAFGVPIQGFLNTDLRLIYNDATGWTLGSVVGPPSTDIQSVADFSKQWWDLGVVGGAGLRFDLTDSIDLMVGLNVETWQVGTLRAESGEPFGIEPDSRTSVTGGIQLLYRSDRRLKTDIVEVGTVANELPLYRFRYRGEPETYIGVMAQDVLEIYPDAVATGPDGYYWVNYLRLGVPFYRIR